MLAIVRNNGRSANVELVSVVEIVAGFLYWIGINTSEKRSQIDIQKNDGYNVFLNLSQNDSTYVSLLPSIDQEKDLFDYSDLLISTNRYGSSMYLVRRVDGKYHEQILFAADLRKNK